MYSDKIKQIRKTLELSVPKLSKKIIIPERTISAYERNERTPSIEFLANMCRYLNINANWFLNDSGEMFNKEPFEEDELAQMVRKIVNEEIQRKGL